MSFLRRLFSGQSTAEHPAVDYAARMERLVREQQLREQADATLLEDLVRENDELRSEVRRLSVLARKGEEAEALEQRLERVEAHAQQMVWLLRVAPKITWGAKVAGQWEATVSRMDFGEVTGRDLSDAVRKAMALEARVSGR